MERDSKRERKFFLSIADGFNNLQIGEYISIIARTIEIHRTNIVVKLDTLLAAHLARFALNKKKMAPSNS